MSDSTLTAIDLFAKNVLEPMTPEGALGRYLPPLLNCCGEDVDRVVFMRRVLSVAREYIKDYDLIRATARAGVDWELTRYFERDPSFILAVDMIQRELTPEDIITKAEVMNLLKREATTASKARDRVAALKELGRIAGFTLGDDGPARGGAPVLNILFNLPPGAQPPTMVNVTPPQPVRLRAPGEEML